MVLLLCADAFQIISFPSYRYKAIMRKILQYLPDGFDVCVYYFLSIVIGSPKALFDVFAGYTLPHIAMQNVQQGKV